MMTIDDQRCNLPGMLRGLVGSRGRAGFITQETIAAALGVSASTVARWGRGDSYPSDRKAVEQITVMYQQRHCWYLRLCPFVLSDRIISNSDPVVHADGDLLPADAYFRQIVLEPIEDEIVRCTATLSVSLERLTLVVKGGHRSQIELSHTVRGGGARRVSFDTKLKIPGVGMCSRLGAGDTITVYLRPLA